MTTEAKEPIFLVAAEGAALEEIERIAKEAGAFLGRPVVVLSHGWRVAGPAEIAVAAEREARAKLAEGWDDKYGPGAGRARCIANAIRARGAP